MRPSDAAGARVRAEAARVVDAVVARGRSLDDALADAESRLQPTDRPLLRMLGYGTLRHHWRLQEFSAALLDKPLKSKDSVIGALLAVGLFQLMESRVPAHAAVSLTVEAARSLRMPKYASVVNAILRNFQRRRLAEERPSNEEALYNHPAWLIGALQADWPEEWRQILEANDARAPMWVRVNARKTTAAAYLETLQADDAAGSDSPAPMAATLDGFPQAIRLAEPRPVASLPGFAEGLVSVQDAAAQLAAPWLLTDGGTRILDACAAPGGKAAHLLELAPAGASLTALDVDQDRLAAVAANLDRLGLSATVVAADASKPDEWWDGEPYDRILLDAPCSGTGVIRRHPDIKLLRRESDIAAAAKRQAELLAALWPLLAPGGRLVYVTCSVLARENDRVVSAFLDDHPSAVEERMLPNYNIRDLMHPKAAGFQILPGSAGLDGFYFACLDKRRAEPSA